MKTPLIAIGAALSISVAPAQEDSFLRQTLIIDGIPVVTDIPLTKYKGTVQSNPLDANTALFELYTNWRKSDGTTELIKLDEKVAGSFLPTIDITITSADSYIPVTTRADQPYSVSMKVSDLVEDTNAPDYAKTVLVGLGYKEYSLVTFAPTGKAGFHEDKWTTQANGTHTEPALTHSLPKVPDDRVAGAEVHAVYSHPDSGLSVQLASEEIIIWPVAYASFSGIEAGETYTDLPDEACVKLIDAYPRSTTYARIYKGSADDDVKPTTITSSAITFGAAADSPNTPQKATMSIGSIANYISTGGQYTIEVVTVTPFNGGEPEKLAAISFTIDLDIKVIGSINSND